MVYLVLHLNYLSTRPKKSINGEALKYGKLAEKQLAHV